MNSPNDILYEYHDHQMLQESSYYISCLLSMQKSCKNIMQKQRAHKEKEIDRK